MKKQTMGETIAALRKKQGMTQMELAEQVGVTDKAVSKWERDLSCPDVNSLPRLAQILGVSVDELMQNKPAVSENKLRKVREAAEYVLKAVPLAMGVGVLVLSEMGKIDLYSGLSMLGLGMACLGILALSQNDKE